MGAPTVSVTEAVMAAPCGSPVSAFNPDGTSTASTGKRAALTRSIKLIHPGPSGRFRPMPNRPSTTNAGRDASSASSFARSVGGFRHVEHLDPAVGQVFAGAAGIVAVMAFAGEDQDQVPGLRQLEGAARHTLPDAANDFRFLLTGGPGGLLPVAHLCNADYRHWHGGEDTPSRPQRKSESAEVMLSADLSMHTSVS